MFVYNHNTINKLFQKMGIGQFFFPCVGNIVNRDNYILVPYSLKKFQKVPHYLKNTKLGSLVCKNNALVP